MKQKRILFVSSEISPFVEAPSLSGADLKLPKLMQEKGSEVRVFMPRYGSINERRHQLHEVIRLSGMNLNVCEVDQPLIIKVASVPKDRLQIYFIDNDDYFKNKGLTDEKTSLPFPDNYERSIFFAKGVLETIKKLNWSPDIIHINGYIAYLLPYFIRTLYKNDPAFAETKIITNIANDNFEGVVCDDFQNKLKSENIAEPCFDVYNFKNLSELAVKYSDACLIAGDKKQDDLLELCKSKNIPVSKLNFAEPSFEAFSEFYKNIL